MTKTFVLFDVPQEVAFSTSQKQILVSSEHTAAVNSSGNLTIFSQVSKSVVGSMSGVSCICWVELTFMKGSVLVALTDNSITVIAFTSELPQGAAFTEKQRIAAFSPTNLNENMVKLCEFKPESRVISLIPFTSNSIVLLDDQNTLKKLSFYPDGVYITKSLSSEGCAKFAWTGLYLAGASESDVHVWTSGLNHVNKFDFASASLCAIGFAKLGVIVGKKMTVVDMVTSERKEVDLDREAQFAVVDNDEVISQPENTILASPSHYLPMFASDNAILSVNSDTYFQRLLSVLPVSVAIPILARGGSSGDGQKFVATTAVKTENTQLVSSYLASQDTKTCLVFIQELTKVIGDSNDQSFASAIYKVVVDYCIKMIVDGNCAEDFSSALIDFRKLVHHMDPEVIPQVSAQAQPAPRIGEENLLPCVLDSLSRNQITSCLSTLETSFRDFEPFDLFRTLVLQQAWLEVCRNQLGEAIKLIEQLGEVPAEHFYEMWKQTTRNGTRALLYDYLHKQEKLRPEDEKNHEILLKITTKYPNTSFISAQKLSAAPAARAMPDESKLPPWQPIVDLTQDFKESKAMIFESLFRIPDEPPVDSPRYFLGNIALIEAQSPQVLKMLAGEGSRVEKLWILHCEHRVNDLAKKFKEEIAENRGGSSKKLKCQKFVDMYYAQMNTYELETLLDIMCKEGGIFAQFEQEKFELLLVRICKNKLLFDKQWWEGKDEFFKEFFLNFAKFCAQKSLFMPFEMFVISHPNAKKIDLSEIHEPLIQFIWDLWVERNPEHATLSCMQFIAKSNSTDLLELWERLPSDSLAPLASFVWNKNPDKFKPGSPETEALSQRLKAEYPLLSSLVKGEIPHPQGPVKEKPASIWRSPIWTSKYDLELHDLIQKHFEEYDFKPVFTDYYGKICPGQPPFPHFDHPELITTPSEPPYVHYVKGMLPVSAFQQAVDDGVSEDEFKNLCLQCMIEALQDKQIRLAALSFIELTDIKFGRDRAIDYKLCVAIYDNLASGDDKALIDDLGELFSRKDKELAQKFQKQLNPDGIELFLICALIGVRCGLPLDYTAITKFASSANTAQLLLYIDRAAELGAHYPISEVVKIVKEKMPENNLKAHLLFHLTQSLPTEEGPTSTDIPPALVVFRAVSRSSDPVTALLQEALNRKVQLYALLATSIEGADLMLCAYVTMLTMSDTPDTFDVTKRLERPIMVKMFLQTLSRLLTEKKSLELKQTMELFGENSIVVNIIHFYRSIELFAFRRAESVLPVLNEKLKDKDTVHDELMGDVPVSSILEILLPMMDALVKHCAEKSQIHVFRYLQVLVGSVTSPFLEPRVKLCKVITGFENFRKAVVHCDLLGDPEKIVSDLVLNHTLALGQAAAECLGISAASATKQWLTFKYSMAATPSQVLEIHNEVVSAIQNADGLFFVALFASLLPYAQPTFVMTIIEYARSLYTTETPLARKLDALLLHLKICKENNIEVTPGSGALPSLSDLLALLFPGVDLPVPGNTVLPKMASPILFGLETLQRFFETSVDKVIDICLDKRQVQNAHLICEWRNRDPRNIQLLEAVQMVISGETLSAEQEEMISTFGSKANMQALLDSIAEKNEWRFVLIALHYKAAVLLGIPTNNLLHRKTSEFIESQLSVTISEWGLVRDLIHTSKMTTGEVAASLTESLITHVKKTLASGSPAPADQLPIDDYTDKFVEFTKLCDCPNVVGEKLFDTVKKTRAELPLAVTVNLLLHSSICTSDIDECAELFDSMLDELTTENQLNLIIDIVSVFPDPALLPRFFQYLIAQQKLDALPHSQLSDKVGRVIMNCARHVHPFEPQKYFDLTLKYNLYRDHAELHRDCGLRLLAEAPEKSKLQEASRHFLLALAYFLHEKCYSLSMECLKRLSLISLQLELTGIDILHLTDAEVLSLMCEKDFPFALTVAVAYDMDRDANWAEAIYEQSVVRKGDDFLSAFQYFRPITLNLCDGVVKKYKAGHPDEEQKNRMKMFLNNIPNLVERYRIAKSLEFTDQIEIMKESYPVVCEWCERVLLSKQ